MKHNNFVAPCCSEDQVQKDTILLNYCTNDIEKLCRSEVWQNLSKTRTNCPYDIDNQTNKKLKI